MENQFMTLANAAIKTVRRSKAAGLLTAPPSGERIGTAIQMPDKGSDEVSAGCRPGIKNPEAVQWNCIGPVGTNHGNDTELPTIAQDSGNKKGQYWPKHDVHNDGSTQLSKVRSNNNRPNLIRLNVDVTQDVNDFLDSFADQTGTSKSEAMRRAFALLRIASDEKKRHRSMGFVSAERDTVLETKIVGVI
jgi:hypothetical protein